MLGCLDASNVILVSGTLHDVERAATIESHSSNISGISFHLNLSMLATAGEDRSIKLWSLVS